MKTRRRKLARLIALTAGLLATSIVVTLNLQGCLNSVVCFFSKPYDKDFYRKNYQVEDGQIYILDTDKGKRYPVKRFFSDGFENAASISDFIGLERGWTSFTLQSPESRTVAAYNKLKKRILNDETSFLDNRVEPSSEQAHSGQQSLKTLAVAPVSGMVCSKASLDTMLLHFVKDDDVWFSAWYYFEKVGEFNTLMDLETTFVRGYPGIRIRLNNGSLDCELKWGSKPVYRQVQSPRTSFPSGRWVHIKTHFRLSEEEDGIIQLWQDGNLVVDQRGQTLPFAGAVYNSMEVGLSAYVGGPSSAVLYVDDVVISARPIIDINGGDITIESNPTSD